ncbi:hypothetical protein CYPRO_2002 [Cyclonatronum proteinivorum]|uniref:Actin-like protein N-terminal domain-containing protein n=1 Tax=Cyclonatronum proteinivorum TaxID=1457365 RepID=A0A345ULA0_9BACT|nr:hypothetical protein [Cyclonatronum proteinivorum]AXJ01252.1 hypothetical protein CYPRO_2002 [Cyclonatronum proteinivorum]
MEIQSVVFPSVIEAYSAQLKGVTRYELNGLKIQEGNTDYLIGNLALTEGKNPHKAINSYVNEADYGLLIKAALLVATKFIHDPLIVTTGFPLSTININKRQAIEYISGIDNIVFDSSPAGGDGYKTRQLDVADVSILGEIEAANKAVRDIPEKKLSKFFIVSLGYGTVEVALSTPDGMVKRTMSSGSGLRYAINRAMDQLNESHYLGLRTEHQFDIAFQKGKIVVNRRPLDLTEIRSRTLKNYYNEVISSLIRNHWSDEDFNTAESLVLVGGGAHYKDLVNCFKEEFDSILEVFIPERPAFQASIGYCLNSLELAEGNKSVCVGIDIGNAQTVISLFKDS